jgi:hypothetical protein
MIIHSQRWFHWDCFSHAVASVKKVSRNTVDNKPSSGGWFAKKSEVKKRRLLDMDDVLGGLE